MSCIEIKGKLVAQRWHATQTAYLFMLRFFVPLIDVDQEFCHNQLVQSVVKRSLNIFTRGVKWEVLVQEVAKDPAMLQCFIMRFCIMQKGNTVHQVIYVEASIIEVLLMVLVLRWVSLAFSRPTEEDLVQREQIDVATTASVMNRDKIG